MLDQEELYGVFNNTPNKTLNSRPVVWSWVGAERSPLACPRDARLAYLRGLIKRARAGTFTPEGALQVADHRKRMAEVNAAIRRNEDRGSDYPPAAVDGENPLVKKMLDIQNRLREKNRELD